MLIPKKYDAELYNESYKETFESVYNDFRNCAEIDYKFELSPLTYEAFIKSLNEELLKCIILFDDSVPVGFLAYTTIISESIELNIIHCIGNDDINQKRKVLLEKFIEINKHLMKEKNVTYPMLGVQDSFVPEILNYGFKTVNTMVMNFKLSDAYSINKVKSMQIKELDNYYAVTNWKDSYKETAVEVLHQSFSGTQDTLFDNRFTTYQGCNDIITKITENIYGQFLPSITKVLLYKRQPIGFCFVNLTNDKIANIPIAAILKKYRGCGFSKILIKNMMIDFLKFIFVESRRIQEINVSCNVENTAAVRMYKSAGFLENYTYKIAYHSGLA